MNKSGDYNYQEKIDKNKLNISKEIMINKNDKKNYSNISNKILKKNKFLSYFKKLFML